MISPRTLAGFETVIGRTPKVPMDITGVVWWAIWVWFGPPSTLASASTTTFLLCPSALAILGLFGLIVLIEGCYLISQMGHLIQCWRVG